MNKEKLIEAVREHSLLYNQGDRLYSDTEKKDAVWREIGKSLSQPHELCKQQWNNLRDSYRRYLKKNKTKSGQSAQAIKKWKYEDEMSFLCPFLKEREPFTSVVAGASEDDVGEGQMSSVDIIQEENGNKEEASRPPKNKRKRSDQRSASSVLLDFLLKEKKRKEQDEIDLFFASIAKTVKRFSPYNKALVKSRIFGIVSEVEMKDLYDS